MGFWPWPIRVSDWTVSTTFVATCTACHQWHLLKMHPERCKHPLVFAGGFAKTVITFICNRNIPQGKPVFRRRDGADTFFDFPTSLACTPDPVDCRVSDDQGNEYDLTPLAKEDVNWRVIDPQRNHLKYYINVCRPLVSTDETRKCPGEQYFRRFGDGSFWNKIKIFILQLDKTARFIWENVVSEN